MRSQPTFTSSSIVISSTTDFAIGSHTLFTGNDSCLLQNQIGGATAGHGCVLLANNSTSAFIAFSAEL